MKNKFTITGVDGFEHPTKCCKMTIYGDDVVNDEGQSLINDKLVIIQLSLNDYVIARHVTGPIYEKTSDVLPSIGTAMRQLEEKKCQMIQKK